MKPVCETHLSEFQLIKPDIGKKYYEISAGNECYASVDLIYGEGTLARLETHKGAYLVERYGFFRPYVSIKEEKTGNIISNSLININVRSVLNLDGANFFFSILDIWKNQWAWLNDKNRPIVKYKLTIDGQIRGYVEVTKDFSYLPDIELIMGLGAYYMVQMQEELSRHEDGVKEIN